jgi:hypothetical protein
MTTRSTIQRIQLSYILKHTNKGFLEYIFRFLFITRIPSAQSHYNSSETIIKHPLCFRIILLA